MGSLCPGGSCTPAEFDAAPPVPTEVPPTPEVPAVLCVTGASAQATAAEHCLSPRAPPSSCPEAAAGAAACASSGEPGESTGGARRKERLCRTTAYGAAAAEPRRVRLAEAPQPGGAAEGPHAGGTLAAAPERAPDSPPPAPQGLPAGCPRPLPPLTPAGGRAAGAEGQPQPQQPREELGVAAPPPAQLTPAAEAPAADAAGSGASPASPPAPAAEGCPRVRSDPFAAALGQAMRMRAVWEEREHEEDRRQRAERRRWEDWIAAAAVEVTPSPPPPPPQHTAPPVDYLRLPTPRRYPAEPAGDPVTLDWLLERCAERLVNAGVDTPPTTKRAGRGGAHRRRTAAGVRRAPAAVPRAARGRSAAAAAAGALARRSPGAPAASAPSTRRRAPAAGMRGRRTQPAAEESPPPPPPDLQLTLPDAAGTVTGIDELYRKQRNAQRLQAGKSEHVGCMLQGYRKRGEKRRAWRPRRDATPKAEW
eukprot:TRINITY_DN15302_c0_g1_i1.p1 TRINITY_DN15302_c0_g1~~TRINITY_DN15302_c0_g1_i1.p1  ORF type:complete len:478 (+),score=75.08 TRINITY_DN15302_c0_g1_i1:85-1518(+)